MKSSKTLSRTIRDLSRLKRRLLRQNRRTATLYKALWECSMFKLLELKIFLTSKTVMLYATKEPSTDKQSLLEAPRPLTVTQI